MSLLCKLLGHKLVLSGENMGIASAFECARCGYHSPAINWPRGHVPPRYPTMPAATPPAMPQIRPALLKIADARKALERAEEAWNLTQLEDAVRSAEYFIAEARKQMAIPHIPMPKP